LWKKQMEEMGQSRNSKAKSLCQGSTKYCTTQFLLTTSKIRSVCQSVLVCLGRVVVCRGPPPFHFTSLAVSLLATRVLSVALPYSGHCSLCSHNNFQHLLISILSAGVLYHRYYCILLHRAHSAHGIPTIAVSVFDGSNSLPTTGTVGRCTVPPILLHLLPP
jgi:hypothetical protein